MTVIPSQTDQAAAAAEAATKHPRQPIPIDLISLPPNSKRCTHAFLLTGRHTQRKAAAGDWVFSCPDKPMKKGRLSATFLFPYGREISVPVAVGHRIAVGWIAIAVAHRRIVGPAIAIAPVIRIGIAVAVRS